MLVFTTSFPPPHNLPNEKLVAAVWEDGLVAYEAISGKYYGGRIDKNRVSQTVEYLRENKFFDDPFLFTAVTHVPVTTIAVFQNDQWAIWKWDERISKGSIATLAEDSKVLLLLSRWLLWRRAIVRLLNTKVRSLNEIEDIIDGHFVRGIDLERVYRSLQ